MVTPEYRSNNRQEFTVNDIDYERTGGCFISYRKIAFAFVFFLAFVIAAAFIGVYIGSPPDKGVSIQRLALARSPSPGQSPTDVRILASSYGPGSLNPLAKPLTRSLLLLPINTLYSIRSHSRPLFSCLG
jgi:hypothetical protein